MGTCSALHSKMMHFHNTEKYCDVKIQVQDRSFPCHRVVLASASEYFDALFGGSFMEKDARETALHDIDVETFQEILTYVYTAEMCEITASNVLNLLSASLFLMIHSLEEACTKYILENVDSIQNHIRILVLARSLNMTALINVVTEHVIINFKSFYEDETLLEITFDDLSSLLDRWWSKEELPFNYEDLLLHFLIHWVHHASEERREYCIELIAAVDFERISPKNVTFLMQYYDDFTDQLSLEEMPPLKLPPVIEKSKSTSDLPDWNWHTDTEDSKKRLSLKRKLPKYFAGDGKLSAICGGEIPAPPHDPTIYKDVLRLHVYVEYTSMDPRGRRLWGRRSKGVKVFSSNECYPDWFISSETDAWRSCTDRRTVVQESTNLLYCMEIFKYGYNPTYSRQTFCTYSSIDLKLASSVLTSPPVPLEENNFNMCVTSKNDIYLLTFGSEGSYCESLVNDQFSLEEINRAFYRYDCEVDKWFPAPKMKTLQNSPCLCADYNLIYSIGGETAESRFSRLFQAFDCRSGKWMTLPMCTSTYYNYWGSSSCVLHDKVFVSKGPSYFQAYDTVAGKWESLCELRRDNKGIKMLSYDSKLWFLYEGDFHDLYSLATYSPTTQEWYHYEGFDDMISKGKPNRTDGIFQYDWNIKDMITFKTCSA